MQVFIIGVSLFNFVFRLRAYTDFTEGLDQIDTLSDNNVERSSDQLNFWEDPDSESYTVIKPDINTTCESISCVTNTGSRTAVCLDMRLVNMSAGGLSGVSRLDTGNTSSKDGLRLMELTCQTLIRCEFF